jgi:hypothetical protein
MRAAGITPDIVHVQNPGGLEVGRVFGDLMILEPVALVPEIEGAPGGLHFLLMFGRALEELKSIRA